jgi:molybdopterin converting factor small subunit
MEVEILVFGPLADAFRVPSLSLRIEPGARVADLRREVLRRWPDSRAILESCAWAVNETYAQADRALAPGDRIALLPPVSGG